MADGDDNLAPIIYNLQQSLIEGAESERTEEQPVPEATPVAESTVKDGIDLSAFYDILWLQPDELAGNAAFLLATKCLKACNLQRQGRSDAVQKAKSLAGRWWSTMCEEASHDIAENASSMRGRACHRIQRNYIFFLDGQHVRVLSVYQKSYNKWRMVTSGDSSAATVVHFARVKQVYDRLTEDSDLGVEDRYRLASGSRFNTARMVKVVAETQNE
eukprot:GHVU01049555.1.p1 GENE.GHVU01049555.1~~GHVU01049555.1.p1  ORF type:complete len:238 (+),score=39.09 GHVU01049555.1:67-714(+)